MSTDFIGKTVVTGSNGKKGKKRKNEAMTGYIFDSHLTRPTLIPSYRLLGALPHPPTPSLRNHFHAKKKIC